MAVHRARRPACDRACRARDLGDGPGGPVRPAVHQEDDDPRSIGQMLGRRGRWTSSGRCGTSTSRPAAASRWRSSVRTAPARARSSRSWPGSSARPRASVDVLGHVSGLLTLGRRLRQGADRPRQHPARRRVPRPRRPRSPASCCPRSSSTPTSASSSTRRSRRIRRACARGSASRSRRRSIPDILLLDEVLATGDANFRAKSKARVIEIVRRRQGRRPRDPRHELGDASTATGPSSSSGAGGHGGRAGRGGRAPPSAHRRARARDEAQALAAGLDPTDRQERRSAAGRHRRTRDRRTHQRATETATIRPSAAPNASAPRQSSSGLTSPSTCPR